MRPGWAIGGELGSWGDDDRMRGNGAVEVFYEPAWQFGFEETGTKIKTPNGVYRPEEKPNYAMALHRVGIRVIWRRPYANS